MLDAGTGARVLGEALRESRKPIFFLLTHLHSDHIHGFPFFAPLYEPGQIVHLLDYQYGAKTWSLLEQFDGVHFPLLPNDMVGEVHRVEGDVLGFLGEHGFETRGLTMNHPGGAYGYRVAHGDCTLVYIPDNELCPPAGGETSFEAIVAFCQGADILCHDAQYLEEDLPLKWGWGHSLVRQACELAIAAQAKHLVLFHHDPCRTDMVLDRVQTEACALLAPHNIACTVAYEGLSFSM